MTLTAWYQAILEIERINIDREKYFLENLRLRAALQRIDGINDNPACYNSMIEEVLRAALEPIAPCDDAEFGMKP